MQEQRGFARRGRALERRPADADDRAAARERWKHVAHPLGTTDGVELAPALGESRRGLEVVVGAESDDEDVCFVDSLVRRHAPRVGIDGGDRLAQEAHARLEDVGVRQADLFCGGSPEHDIEFRVAEDERVALVDQRDAGVVTERLGQESRELETGKPRAQDDDARIHRQSLTGRRRPAWCGRAPA